MAKKRTSKEASSGAERPLGEQLLLLTLDGLIPTEERQKSDQALKEMADARRRAEYESTRIRLA